MIARFDMLLGASIQAHGAWFAARGSARAAVAAMTPGGSSTAALNQSPAARLSGGKKEGKSPASAERRNSSSSAAKGVAAGQKPRKTKTVAITIVFPDNTMLVREFKAMKTEADNLSTTFDGIHDWIALNVPDVKEEDNAGVEVMGAVISQVSNLSESIRDIYNADLKYLEERGDLEKRLLKYPTVEGVKRQLLLHDEDAWDELERGWRSMIRLVVILYSVLNKNMAKLLEPRVQRSAYTM
jgi:hypothetical protein